jgi:thiosulfate reductase cytochrome b subunit
MSEDTAGETPTDEKSKGSLIYRQSAWTRVTHWIWAICLFFLMMSGLQIFNARPDLYIGRDSGFEYDNTVLSIRASTQNGRRVGITTLFGMEYDTTGFLGAWGENNSQTTAIHGAFTIPSTRDLSTGRVVHFFFAWVFVGIVLIWLIASLVNGHLWRDVIPRLRDWRRLPADILDHIKLKFHHTASYNVVQKITYAVVLVILFPTMILTGLTMSPGMDAVFPWLIELFAGRQTARTIHFLVMLLLIAFFIVHIVMVVAAGPINELRSMITGWYRADPDHKPERK